jgi:hypothetical protein
MLATSRKDVTDILEIFGPKDWSTQPKGFNPINANLERGPSMGEWLSSRRDG